MYPPEKLDGSRKFCVPELSLSASSAQFADLWFEKVMIPIRIEKKKK